MLKIYNSLTKQVEEFKPIGDSVSIYSCGPTVYDDVHIGNLSSFIFADNINRAVELNGNKIKHIMNITDVDDKTITRSRSDYPEDSPEVALKELTTLYEHNFMDQIKEVGIRIDRFEYIRATESIEQMQKLIRELITGGFAYIADDGIYFSIDNYQKSGKKYGQLLELDIDNTSKARINNDEYDKHSTHDFALWKLMRPEEPSWSFEIDGKDYIGRPGWHIECSAMSTNSLGEPFDIHTGGIDLIFPHHENEIAQSTAGKDSPTYAKYFCHNDHLLVDKKKMSKSLGNIYTLKHLDEKNYDPLSYRLLVLQGHYRNQTNFSWELLDAAQNRLVDLRNFAALKFQTINNSNYNFNETISSLKEAFLDDLNTPRVLAILSEFVNKVQETLVGDNQKNDFTKFLEFIDLILGLRLSNIKDIEEEQKDLLQQRETAREKKEWEKSDKLRDELLSQGISIRDTTSGQIWGYNYSSSFR